MGGFRPAAAVLVATMRSIKMNGGVAKHELAAENLEALARGAANLRRHLRNVTQVYGLPCVVALNRFPTDTRAEIDLLRLIVEEEGCTMVETDVFACGGAGGEALARQVVALCETPAAMRFVYEDSDPLDVKLTKIATAVYGADGVDFGRDARKMLDRLQAEGFATAPVCIAKTQYSFSDDPNRLGAPTGWRLTIREVRPSAGAGFVVALAGDMMTMPGMPAMPAAERIDIDAAGRIEGLF